VSIIERIKQFFSNAGQTIKRFLGIKEKPKISYEGIILPKTKKEMQNVDDTVIRIMFKFGMSPYEIYTTIKQFPCMSGISLKYIREYLNGMEDVFNTVGRLQERIDVMYEFAKEGYLTDIEAESQVRLLRINYLKSALITVLDEYGKSDETKDSLLRAFRRRYGCILDFDNERYSFYIHEK
jgi:hypothetical protein